MKSVCVILAEAAAWVWHSSPFSLRMYSECMRCHPMCHLQWHYTLLHVNTSIDSTIRLFRLRTTSRLIHNHIAGRKLIEQSITLELPVLWTICTFSWYSCVTFEHWEMFWNDILSRSFHCHTKTYNSQKSTNSYGRIKYNDNITFQNMLIMPFDERKRRLYVTLHTKSTITIDIYHKITYCTRQHILIPQSPAPLPLLAPPSLPTHTANWMTQFVMVFG